MDMHICISVMPGRAGGGNSRCIYTPTIFIAHVYKRLYYLHVHTCIICVYILIHIYVYV